jgi:hypothetical protein
MNANILAIADALSGPDLLARLHVLAGNEREAATELVAHLASLEARPALYAAQGYGSLFAYCTQALRLSEDVACNRIDVARACRRFPVILEQLSSGSVTLTSVRLLAPHLTAANHETVLARASGGNRRMIEALVAELAPRPDVPSSVRKLPTFTVMPASSATPAPAVSAASSEPIPAIAPSPALLAPTPRRPVVRASAPERYRVQFTIGQETHEKLRRVQALLRREITSGDPAAIFDRALTLLLEKVEKTKVPAVDKPRARSIRPETDREAENGRLPSRHIANDVKRTVWQREAGQCAFVSAMGHRCTERTFLEFHHIQPYARGGPATAANVSLRCRRHNRYEAELIFGPRSDSTVGQGTHPSTMHGP